LIALRQVCEKSSKVITFIDLAGHEKYLKTTGWNKNCTAQQKRRFSRLNCIDCFRFSVFGMTGHVPDFGMLMVGANAGIVGMTKEHLGLALALR
jgi:GTPase